MYEFAADPPIEERLGTALRERGETVAVAETVTGGLVGALLTSVPGASDYVDRALVPYAYDAHRDLCAVPRETLDDRGAVSKPTARALARAARDTADTTWGVSTSGIAGPGGGTDERPIGTAVIGVAYAADWGTGDSHASAERYEFDGDRGAVRERIARQTLRDLYETLEDASG